MWVTLFISQFQVLFRMTCNFFEEIALEFCKTKLHKLFRRKVIKYFEENKLINSDFAKNLLSWKNSGFSIDNSVRIFGSNDKARESLAQYIARCPISLEKLKYEPFHSKVLFKTPKYNDYFKENFRVFDALDTLFNLYNWNTTKL